MDSQEDRLNMGCRFLSVLTGLLLLVLLPAGARGADMSLPADFLAFHAASPWNTPIGDAPRIDPASAAMMRRLQSEAGRLKADHKKWSIPLFVVDAAKAPRVTGLFTKTSNPLIDPNGTGKVSGLPIPKGAWPDPERDGHMLIIDPTLMVSWDLSRAMRLRDGSWRASRIDIWDLKGMGVRRPFKGRTWWSYGARGSGFPLIAGLIRPEEITAGEIRHALVFSSPITRKSVVPNGPLELCPPASRSDGTQYGPDTIPMGARLQLDPALDLDRLGLSPEIKVIARALQRYGMYNSDSTHEVFKLYLQNLGPDGGAWAGMDFSSLSRIPISRFRVLGCDIAVKK